MYNSHNCKHWQEGEVCGAGIGPDNKERVSMCWSSYGLNGEFCACYEKVNGIDRYKGKRVRDDRNDRPKQA